MMTDRNEKATMALSSENLKRPPVCSAIKITLLPIILSTGYNRICGESTAHPGGLITTHLII
jgi:hypothetical protein